MNEVGETLSQVSLMSLMNDLVNQPYFISFEWCRNLTLAAVGALCACMMRAGEVKAGAAGGSLPPLVQSFVDTGDGTAKEKQGRALQSDNSEGHARSPAQSNLSSPPLAVHTPARSAGPARSPARRYNGAELEIGEVSCWNGCALRAQCVSECGWCLV
jgi:hypothetical protein